MLCFLFGAYGLAQDGTIDIRNNQPREKAVQEQVLWDLEKVEIIFIFYFIFKLFLAWS